MPARVCIWIVSSVLIGGELTNAQEDSSGAFSRHAAGLRQNCQQHCICGLVIAVDDLLESSCFISVSAVPSPNAALKSFQNA